MFLYIRDAKGNFFDRVKVVRATEKATFRALMKIGAFVRQRAKTSIRKRKKVSPPGGPPSGHVGNLRRAIKFAVERGRQSVVIGPERLGSTVDPAALPALEYGGESTALDRRKGERRPIAVRERPFMGPALRAELPGLPALWRDSVR